MGPIYNAHGNAGRLDQELSGLITPKVTSVGVNEIQVILNTFKVFCILYFVVLTKVICIL